MGVLKELHKNYIKPKLVAPLQTHVVTISFLFFIGAMAIYLFIKLTGEKSYIEISNLCFDIWKTALTVFVFTAVVKSEQFTEIFSTILSKIVHSKDHLDNRKDIENIWIVVTESILGRYFPESIKPQIIKFIKEEALVGSDYYFNELSKVITIQIPEDLALRDKYIKVTDTTIYKPKCLTNANLELKCTTNVIRQKNDSQTKLLLKELEVNGTTLVTETADETTNEIILPSTENIPEEPIPSDQPYIIYRQEKQMEGEGKENNNKETIHIRCRLKDTETRHNSEEEHRVKIKTERIYSVEIDDELVLYSARFARNPQVTIEYPTNYVNIIFISTSFTKKKEETPTNDSQKVFYKMNGWLKPKDGYSVKIKRRT